MDRSLQNFVISWQSLLFFPSGWRSFSLLPCIQKEFIFHLFYRQLPFCWTLNWTQNQPKELVYYTNQSFCETIKNRCARESSVTSSPSSMIFFLLLVPRKKQQWAQYTKQRQRADEWRDKTKYAHIHINSIFVLKKRTRFLSSIINTIQSTINIKANTFQIFC